MKKAISLTLGVVVCSFISAQFDTAQAQGVATGPVNLAPAAAPAAVATPVNTGAGASMVPAAGAAATAAAGSMGAATTIVPVSNGAGASNGAGESNGFGTSTGPNPTFGPGSSFGPGNSTGPNINSGVNNGSNPSRNTGVPASMAPSRANVGTLSQGAGLGNGTGGTSRSSLQLRGTVSNMANNGLVTMGRLASNPNFTLAQNQAGQFFIVQPNGQMQSVPVGTDVAALLGSSSSASLTAMQKASMFNPYASPYESTPMTLVHLTNDGNVPMAMSTRNVYTNGYPTFVSGQIISEYPRTKVESFARVYPKKAKKHASARKCTTQRRVYLKK